MSLPTCAKKYDIWHFDLVESFLSLVKGMTVKFNMIDWLFVELQ